MTMYVRYKEAPSLAHSNPEGRFPRIRNNYCRDLASWDAGMQITETCARETDVQVGAARSNPHGCKL